MLKFGKEVRIEVADASGKIILDSSQLRVDFDIRLIPAMVQGKFSIYNLDPVVAGNIINGRRFVRLFVSLHGQQEQRLPYDFALSNGVTYKDVPNSITELYCISTIKKKFLSKQISVEVSNPGLKEYCNELARVSGEDVTFKYTDFPNEVLNYRPPSPTAVWSGTVVGALEKLGRSYSFAIAEESDSTINLIYQPNTRNQGTSGQDRRKGYVLQTNQMRSNPSVGIVELKIDSQLDLGIRIGTMLDTSELISVTALEDFDFNTIVANQIKNSVAGNGRFSTLTVQHIGSNFTQAWNTRASALKAGSGHKIKLEAKEQIKKAKYGR